MCVLAKTNSKELKSYSKTHPHQGGQRGKWGNGLTLQTNSEAGHGSEIIDWHSGFAAGVSRPNPPYHNITVGLHLQSGYTLTT